jgi:hypothetical protein
VNERESESKKMRRSKTNSSKFRTIAKENYFSEFYQNENVKNYYFKT